MQVFAVNTFSIIITTSTHMHSSYNNTFSDVSTKLKEHMQKQTLAIVFLVTLLKMYFF